MLFSYKNLRYSTVKRGRNHTTENEFKVIETQEELNKIIQKRLAQKDKELAESIKGYLKPEEVEDLKADFEKQLSESKKALEEAETKLREHDAEVSDLKEKAAAAETKLLKSKIAHETGLPFELAERIVGNTEEELKQDAENLKAIIAPSRLAPLATRDISTAAPRTTNTDPSMLALLGQLNEQMAATN